MDCQFAAQQQPVLTLPDSLRQSTLGYHVKSSRTPRYACVVFLGQTSDDEVIDVRLGQQTRSVLENLGMAVNLEGGWGI